MRSIGSRNKSALDLSQFSSPATPNSDRQPNAHVHPCKRLHISCIVLWLPLHSSRLYSLRKVIS
jgi:hypothetical protein